MRHQLGFNVRDQLPGSLQGLAWIIENFTVSDKEQGWNLNLLPFLCLDHRTHYALGPHPGYTDNVSFLISP